VKATIGKDSSSQPTPSGLVGDREKELGR